jgi:predicted ATP-grasp superfamily ATP-dependent carboligase
VLPPQELVEDLVDKLRFAALAERLSLPVPATRVVRRGDALDGWNRFPCVLKPAMRTHWFESGLLPTVGSTAKALRIEDRAELERLWPLAQRHETDFVLQQAVEGDEACILSYHAYVREGGAVVAEFTGKKVRTTPRVYGISTCVEITDDAEVKRVGRDVLARLDFDGVLKMDFKQDPRDGRLYLLEINPRFNLWHHPAAVAGVCLPELVYRDCLEAGSARTPQSVRPGVRWLNTRDDFQAFREYRAAGELSPVSWLLDVLSADVREDLTVDDPLPGLLGVGAIVMRKLRRLRALRS